MNIRFRLARRVRGLIRPSHPASSTPLHPNNDTSLIARPRRSTFDVNHELFRDIEEFMTSPYVPAGVVSLWYLGLPIDLSLAPVPGKPLIVVLHGAANSEVRLPWLSGGGVTQGVDASRLSISDPSLYLHPDLNLSWFAGSVVQPNLPDVLVSVVKKVMESTQASKLILFGGSGGGYASLRLASMIKGSTAVVMNPQTDIEKYHPMHVQRYIDLAWNGDRRLMKSSVQTEVTPSVSKNRDKMSVFYIQNSADTFHLNSHLEPFRQELQGSTGFYLLQDRWREGHTPPPKEVVHDILEQCVQGAKTGEMSRVGFTPM